MRRIVLLLIFMLLLSFTAVARSERTTLKLGESFDFAGLNFTLMNVSPRTDAALFCINNEKAIFVEGKRKRFNNATVDIIRVGTEDVRFEVEADRSNICNQECSNAKCFFECKTDLDCDDNDKETFDRCVGGKCRNIILGNEKTFLEKNISELDKAKLDKENGEGGKSQFLAFTFVLVLAVVLLFLFLFLNKRKGL